MVSAIKNVANGQRARGRRMGNGAATEMLRAMRGFLGENDMMAVRLIELHRVLKPINVTNYLPSSMMMLPNPLLSY